MYGVSTLFHFKRCSLPLGTRADITRPDGWCSAKTLHERIRCTQKMSLKKPSRVKVEQIQSNHAPAFGLRMIKTAPLVLALLLVSPAFAGTVITGLSLSVEGNDTVTVHNTGTSAFAGGVGDAGYYDYINGWGYESGSILWKDTNRKDTLRLDDSGIDVLNEGGIANSNGSKSGTVQLTGSRVLGAALRAQAGVGTDLAFTSTISRGSVDFKVSGTVTIAETLPSIVITGLSLSVAGNDAVTVNNTGSSVFLGYVGDAGSYGYINGWGHVSGSILWKDTNRKDTLRLDDSGIDVLNDGGVANSNGRKSGTVQLNGSRALGAALRASHGEGTDMAFFSTISQNSDVNFGVEGTVTVLPAISPDPVNGNGPPNLVLLVNTWVSGTVTYRDGSPASDHRVWVDVAWVHPEDSTISKGRIWRELQTTSNGTYEVTMGLPVSHGDRLWLTIRISDEPGEEFVHNKNREELQTTAGEDLNVNFVLDRDPKVGDPILIHGTFACTTGEPLAGLPFAVRGTFTGPQPNFGVAGTTDADGRYEALLNESGMLHNGKTLEIFVLLFDANDQPLQGAPVVSIILGEKMGSE